MLRAWTKLCRVVFQRRIHSGIPRARQIKPDEVPRSFPALESLDKENVGLLAVIDKRIRELNALIVRISLSETGTPNAEQSTRLKAMDKPYEAWRTWQIARESLVETANLLEDEESGIRELAEEEYQKLWGKYDVLLRETLPKLLLPQSKTEDISALVEINPGVGGSESSLFIEELLRMYSRYANVRGWSARTIVKEDKERGGVKKATLEVDGEGAYDCLRWESGVHRVQRVPKTEASGRVHTSTVRVLVLPLTKENSNTDGDRDVLDEKDVRIEVMRARGAGGQHVNKTESAVRLTHIPTGITVSMQDERSQHMNKARAFKVLHARLLDRKFQAEIAERRETRRKLVKSADRSEKIRTYNFAQDRVTDHRIGMTVKNVANVLDGDGLQDIIDAIQADHRQELIEEILETDS